MSKTRGKHPYVPLNIDGRTIRSQNTHMMLMSKLAINKEYDMKSLIGAGESDRMGQITVIRHVNKAVKEGELVRRRSGKRVLYTRVSKRSMDQMKLVEALSKLIPPRLDQDPEVQPLITAVFHVGLASLLTTTSDAVVSLSKSTDETETRLIAETNAALLSFHLTELGNALRLHKKQTASLIHFADYIKTMAENEGRQTEDIQTLLDFILDARINSFPPPKDVDISFKSLRDRYPEMSDEAFDKWQRIAQKVYQSPKELLSL